MKPNAVTCLLLIACVLNLLFGCSHRKAVPLPELEQAEAVMFEHPDRRNANNYCLFLPIR